jgi:uncharacterized protein YlxP (DUF503 family)
MYKQFKFSCGKKSAKNERRKKKKKEVVSELKHKFNISFLICGCLAEKKTERTRSRFQVSLATISVVSSWRTELNDVVISGEIPVGSKKKERRTTFVTKQSILSNWDLLIPLANH